MLLFGTKPQSIVEPPRGIKRSIVVITLLWALGSVLMLTSEAYARIRSAVYATGRFKKL